MLFTVDTLYILTTQKKGQSLGSRGNRSALGSTNTSSAKHLDQLKGGRFPIEVLVRGKDAAENERLFVQVAEKIKEAGVRHPAARRVERWLTILWA